MRTRLAALTLVLLGGAAAAALAQPVSSPMLELAKIQAGAKSRRVSSYDTTGGNGDNLPNIAPGTRRTLFDVKGAGIITHVWVTIAPPPPALSRHDIILRMYWDGETTPSVEAPIGDFFGQGWDECYPFVSLPLAAGPREGRAMVSYFAMPFAKGARIEIENDAEKPIDAFYYYVDYTELAALPADLGRFHAWYNHSLTEAARTARTSGRCSGRRRRTPPASATTSSPTSRARATTWASTTTSTTRRSCGTARATTCSSSTASDGRRRCTGPAPRTTSTRRGRRTSLYQHPYYGYARVNGGTGWLGRTHVYRFHLADPVYFDKSLRFTIEHGHDDNLTLDLSSVAYWYQTEPHKPFPPFPSRASRKPMPAINEVDIHLWRDAWRKSKGYGPQLWGNEKDQPKQD